MKKKQKTSKTFMANFPTVTENFVVIQLKIKTKHFLQIGYEKSTFHKNKYDPYNEYAIKKKQCMQVREK